MTGGATITLGGAGFALKRADFTAKMVRAVYAISVLPTMIVARHDAMLELAAQLRAVSAIVV